MEENKPSFTAMRVALRRAAHQILDVPPVFEDALAMKILGQETAGKIFAEAEKHQEPIPRALRAFVSARSRYAEDKLQEAFCRGVRQYVLLGAGLDTFAYRNPHPGLHVFEVDHPATQGWKRELLANAGMTIPASLTFVPVDFEKEDLANQLAEAGFRTDLPAFFGWLGVTPYLTMETFRTTMSFMGSLPVKTGVAFDYGISPHLLNAKQVLAFGALAQQVKRVGEPFQLFFTPSEVEDELKRAGFSQIEDLDGTAIQNRYFISRTDGLNVGSIARLTSGWKL
jgi:methyltransferase (TIGR00027 family)